MLQTTMLGLILVLLVIILIMGIFIISLFFAPIGGLFGRRSGLSMKDTIDALKDNQHDKIVRLIKDDNNIDERGEFDKERQVAIEGLRQFALDKIEKEKKEKKENKGSPGEVLVNGQGSGPVASGREYIPYNLNERQKEILRMFNQK